MKSYAEDQILNYIASLHKWSNVPSQYKSLSPECFSSLQRVSLLLISNRTSDQQRQFFRESFGRGDASQFVSRDLDRLDYCQTSS